MSRTFEQLSAEQRYTIQQLNELKFTQTAIVKTIGIHKSTISRELRRNAMYNGKYKSINAQQYTLFRHCFKPKYIRLTATLKTKIRCLLQQDFSPQQISNRLSLEGLDTVSHEAIYLHIWKDKQQNGTLYQYLTRKQRGRRKRGNKTDYRGQIANKISIEQRPVVANNRERFGDFEQDTIIGANHKGAILTLVDRKTLFTKLVLLEGKNATQLAEHTIKTLKDFMPFLHTITSDNGKEFALHQTIAEQLGIQYFFTHPYSSYECGTVENTNGLIRRYIPKKTSFENLTQQRLNEIEHKLNNRPRKKLNYYTPNEIVNAIFNNVKPILNKVAFIT
ncbi:MAG: IS30 family transposase [Chitinophagales bacterium]